MHAGSEQAFCGVRCSFGWFGSRLARPSCPPKLCTPFSSNVTYLRWRLNINCLLSNIPWRLTIEIMPFPPSKAPLYLPPSAVLSISRNQYTGPYSGNHWISRQYWRRWYWITYHWKCTVATNHNTASAIWLIINTGLRILEIDDGILRFQKSVCCLLVWFENSEWKLPSHPSPILSRAQDEASLSCWFCKYFSLPILSKSPI